MVLCPSMNTGVNPHIDEGDVSWMLQIKTMEKGEGF